MVEIEKIEVVAELPLRRNVLLCVANYHEMYNSDHLNGELLRCNGDHEG